VGRGKDKLGCPEPEGDRKQKTTREKQTVRGREKSAVRQTGNRKVVEASLHLESENQTGLGSIKWLSQGGETITEKIFLLSK